MSYTESGLFFASDLDLTLIAGQKDEPDVHRAANADLMLLNTLIESERQAHPERPFYFASCSGRTIKSQREELAKPDDPTQTAFRYAISKRGPMNAMIGSVGVEIEIRNTGGDFKPVLDWPDAANWNREAIQSLLMSQTPEGELDLQPDIAQDRNKLSFDVHAPSLTEEQYRAKIIGLIGGTTLAASVIVSSGHGMKFLDILPQDSNGKTTDKGAAIVQTSRLLAEKDSRDKEPMIVFAGDSGNDIGAANATILANGLVIVPANASIEKWARKHEAYGRQIFIAEANFAAGIIEVMRKRGLLTS